MSTVHAYAATSPSSPLTPFTYELPPIDAEHVDIRVEYCGICHSDLSMLRNEWGFTTYPLVPGHEVVGRVEVVGSLVKNLKVGDRVGLGWFSESCMTCPQCMGGDHNLCGSGEGTIVGRHGGFADLVRAHWAWAIKIPEALPAVSAGPLFCGGITVFSPIVEFNVRPTDRVGVIGAGGLGHLAIQFLNKWGCEVTAFSSTPDKADELTKLGAHRVVNSRDSEALKAEAGRFDFIISTVAVPLEWMAYVAALAPKGRLHTVGAIPEPVALEAFPLIMGQRSFSGSPLGSPATTALMLEFCARHGIAPMVEEFPLSEVNKAIDRLENGSPRYRVVLKA
ncbi:NAD(P)-dependent alcohol dehydrogenase [bacterium]|nr:NAD(P)-dependent alcohol dehydrogenase [bacterium]NBS52489.1 NAD(P)-dependent alcohol dehydrogenase [Spartobacteria bacterium]